MTITKEQNLSKKIWTAADYVQDSAVFFLDARENSGFGKPFDVNATTWCDLAPNPSNQAVGDKTYYGWASDYAFIANRTASDKRWKQRSQLKSDAVKAIDSFKFSIEMLLRPYDGGAVTNLNPLYLAGTSIQTGEISYAWISFVGSPHNLIENIGQMNVNGKRLGIQEAQVPFGDTHLLTLTNDAGHFTSYFDGVETGALDTTQQYNQGGWYIGNNVEVRRFAIHARALSQEEIALNYNIDQRRFTP